jgi:hypothetical protein
VDFRHFCITTILTDFQLFAIALTVTTAISESQYGWDRHIWDVPPHWLFQGGRYSIAGYVCFGFGLASYKFSLLMYYKHVTDARKMHMILWWVVTIGVAAWLVIYEVLARYMHLARLPEWGGIVSIVLAGINIFTDLAVVLLPLDLLWKVSSAASERALLIAFFVTGILTASVSVGRVVYSAIHLDGMGDTTWLLPPLWTIGCAELFLGIVSIPFALYHPLDHSIY